MAPRVTRVTRASASVAPDDQGSKSHSRPRLGAQPKRRRRKRVLREQSATESEDVEQLPRSKRPKRQQWKKEGERSAVQTKRGKLQSLMEKLPIEIVSEICSHLGPPDLLHLVRSAKNFAQYLLRPSAAGVWKAAREECALDMPPIHPDLTEQKYAFLGFGSTCQNCGSITRSAVDWYLRRRWCSACQEIVIESEYCDLNRKWNQLIEDKRQRWKHDAIIHQNWVSVHEGRARRQYRSFLACPISEYNAFLLKAQELTDKEWKVYVAEQQEKKEALTMHAKLCMGWIKRRISSHQDELLALRHDRKAAVRSRLQDMGFAEVFIDLAIHDGFTGLQVSKRLTNNEWARMENRVVGVVRKHEQDYVTRGLYYANQCVISKYRPWYECHNPGDEFWPLPFDIWAVPAVKDLLIEYMESTLHQVQDRRHYPEVPDTVLDSLTLRFKEIANDYSMNSKTELMKLIPDEFKLSSMQETLGLARTLFAKPPDSTITRYPCPPRGRYGWRWCKLASAIMSDIITLAGHDPNAMAFPQLLEEDIWVECLTCAQPDQGTKAKVFVAMDAVVHCYKSHRLNTVTYKKAVRWRILEGQELESARTSGGVVNGRWPCLLCEYGTYKGPDFASEDSVLEHISSQHPGARPDLQYCYLGPHHQAPRKPVLIQHTLETPG